MMQLPVYCYSVLAPSTGERRRRYSESEGGPRYPSQRGGLSRRRLIPRTSDLTSLRARQRALFIKARTLPHTAAASSHLHRLSVDFAHHPTLLLFHEAEVGERLLSHSLLGSWSTPSLASLQHRTKLEPCSKGRPRRAEPTLPRWSLLIKPLKKKKKKERRKKKTGARFAQRNHSPA